MTRLAALFFAWPALGLTLLLIATPQMPPARADGACGNVRFAGAPGMSLRDAYNPFAPTDLTEMGAFTLINASGEPCHLFMVFTAPDGARTLTAGNDSLSYALESAAGALLLNPPSVTDPEAARHIRLTLLPDSAMGISLRVRVPGQQMASPGAYQDNTALLRLYTAPDDGFGELIAERAFPIAVEVAAVCSMSAPQPGRLDFSSDIGADARPAGQWRHVLLPDASCNTAARLKLEASALASASSHVASGFDAFIDIEAQATFASVSAALLTAGPDQRIEAYSTSSSSQDSPSSSIDVKIRLRPARPLTAGAYGSVLTIALEPSP